MRAADLFSGAARRLFPKGARPSALSQIHQWAGCAGMLLLAYLGGRAAGPIPALACGLAAAAMAAAATAGALSHGIRGEGSSVVASCGLGKRRRETSKPAGAVRSVRIISMPILGRFGARRLEVAFEDGVLWTMGPATGAEAAAAQIEEARRLSLGADAACPGQERLAAPARRLVRAVPASKRRP